MAKTKTKTTMVGEKKAHRAMKKKAKKAKQAMRKTTKAKRSMRTTRPTQDEADPFVKKSELDDACSEMMEREFGCYESDDLQQAMLDELQLIVKSMAEDLTDQGFRFRPCVKAYVDGPHGLQVPLGPQKRRVIFTTENQATSSCGA